MANSNEVPPKEPSPQHDKAIRRISEMLTQGDTGHTNKEGGIDPHFPHRRQARREKIGENITGFPTWIERSQPKDN